MSGWASYWRNVGVVVLGLAEVVCGYHLVYWYWMTISAPEQLKTSEDHLRFWLTAAVIVGLSWMYLVWQSLLAIIEARVAAKKKTASLRKRSIPEVGASREGGR
jgi:hypothetical protein